MKINFKDFILKQEYDRIRILHYAHFFLLIFSILLKILYGASSLWAFGLIIIAYILYQLHYKMVVELRYTFWPFSAILAFYFIWGLLKSIFVLNVPGLSYVFFLALIFLAIELYILLSPIYYPRVKWWEYDFRYRHDLKIKIFHESKTFDGRLTDLRRKAGCVLCFEDFKVDEDLTINLVKGEETFLKGKIMSRREMAPGRGITYGVKFLFDTNEALEDYRKLSALWKSEGKNKVRMKFKDKIN